MGCTSPIQMPVRQVDLSYIKKIMKPKDYSTISPYLIVNQAEDVLDFIKKVFGATELRRYTNPDGSLMHIELRIEDSVIMLGEAGQQWPAFPSMLHVYVDNVEAVYPAGACCGSTTGTRTPTTGGRPRQTRQLQRSVRQHLVGCQRSRIFEFTYKGQ